MESIVNLLSQHIDCLRHVRLRQRTEDCLPHRAFHVLHRSRRVGLDGSHQILAESLGLRMDQGSHVLKFLGSGIADKGDVIGVVDVGASGGNVRQIVGERYLAVVAGHLDLGLGLPQGLVVFDRHFTALLQRQRLLGIRRQRHHGHRDQC